MGARGVVAVVAAWVMVLIALPAPAGAVASPAPQPVVHGNVLVDARTGAAWVPRAVNWPSFEYACVQGWGYSGSGRTAAAAAAMAAWGIDAVRIPLNESCWLGTEGAPTFGTMSGYRAAVASWVGLLNAAGVVAILDLHWSAPAGTLSYGQRAMPDARSPAFWASVAAAFAGSPSVMFDLYNEPYSRWNDATGSWAFSLTWECWRDGGCQVPLADDQSALTGATYPASGMASLVAAVRGAGATQPIMLAGIDYANDVRGWLAHRPDDDQLVVSWHNYQAQRCRTTTCWDAEITPLSAEVPVIMSEFGETDGGNGFLTTVMNWADRAAVGYSPWAWWIVDASEDLAASRYALIADGTFTPKAPSGTTLHDHLASDRIGAFADVATGHQFFADIQWMWARGLSNGSASPAGTVFEPGAAVTRQAMAAFLYRDSGETFTPPATPSFVDVPTTHPFYREIEWMRARGLTTGIAGPGGLRFAPDDAVTRQAMAAFLYRRAGSPAVAGGTGFVDVPADHAFATPISWLRQSGISVGYPGDGGTEFHPEEDVSRQAMAAFLHRAEPAG